MILTKMKANWEKIVFWIVFISLVASAVYAAVNMIMAPSTATPDIFIKLKSDYALMLIQCILGIVVIFLPSLIELKMRIQVPSYMHIVFTVFLFASIYLGEIRSFYYKIPNWDMILHTFSGLMLGALGFSIVSLLNKMDIINLSPLFVAAFAFFFAISLGVVWEIYEFSIDGLLGLNMQKFTLENGSAMVGRAALMDTMEDLIVDMLGAFIMALIGYVSLKYKKGWIEKILLKRS